jgi:DNA-binding transcriptional ArsR family regulator
VVDLAGSVGLAQPTVSGHLASLRDCGLVTWRPVGRQSYYRLAVAELDELLRAAETVLAHTGDAVVLCPNYGTPLTPQGPTDARGGAA